MSNLSFKFCPVCNSEIVTGKISLPIEQGFKSMQWIEWFSEKKITNNKRRILRMAYDKRTAVNKCGSNVPAGYCEKCDRIFAEFDIREKYNPIGEETLPTYDMDYYEESADSLYEDKITSYDMESYDEKYNIIGRYKIVNDNINFKKSED